MLFAIWFDDCFVAKVLCMWCLLFKDDGAHVDIAACSF